MRVLLGSGDEEVAEALAGAFADDHVQAVRLRTLAEPDAFRCIDELRPGAVITTPDWSRDDDDDVRGVWWLARAAELARVPFLLLSTAAVFDPADRRPRSEFDPPSPAGGPGRLAHSAEQVVERTTRRFVIVRVGPLDVGTGSLARLLESPDGVAGGGTLTTSPVCVGDIATTLRHLAVARRYGVWHLAAETLSMAECAARLALAEPRSGATPVPVPLAARMLRFSGGADLDAWPPAPGAVARPSRTPSGEVA